MKKTEKKRNATPAVRESDAPRPAWVALIGAFRDGMEWTLDRAVHFARAYPDEVECVERVRTFMRARIANRKARIEFDDLLFTFTLVLGALEYDLNRIGAFGSWLREEPIHLPRATDLERQWMEQLLFTYQALQSRVRVAA